VLLGERLQLEPCTIADMVKTKAGTKEAERVIKADQEQTEEINDILQLMARMIERIIEWVDSICNNNNFCDSPLGARGIYTE